MSQFESHPEDGVVAPSRTSALAIASLIMSMICCIPGLGAIGTLLGAGAIVSISKSDGRVKGTGLAVTGIIIGILTTLLWIFGATGMAMGARQLAKYDQMIVVIEARDRAAITDWITSDADASLTDEQLEAFADSLQADYGSFVAIPSSLSDIFGAYMTVGQGVSTAQAAAQSEGYAQPIPIPVEFDGGTTVVIVAGDDTPPMAPNDMPRARNVGYLAPDGSLVWLIDPGP